MKTLILVTLLIIMSSCTSRKEDKVTLNKLMYGVAKFEDPELGIVCYTIYGEGISCVKIKEVAK